MEASPISSRMRAAVPDPDAGQGGQDPGERVCIEYPLDLGGNGFALLENGFQALGQPG